MTIADRLREEGRQEGWQEGIRLAAYYAARNMILMGLDLKFIVEVTELTEEEIKNLMNV
jgi:predicted transposase/invertase (TIGR01784 family)